jgi:hypothetical protein
MFQLLVILIPSSRTTNDGLYNYLMKLFEDAKSSEYKHVMPQYISSMSLKDLTKHMFSLG